MLFGYIKNFKDKHAPTGSFRANVFTLMTGTTTAQIVPILASPVLTRIYPPADFGVFALYFSITSVIATIATARYELAVMLPEKDEDAFNLAALSIMIAAGVSILTLLVFWLFNTPISILLGNPLISSWLYFVPLSVFAAGMFQALNYWSSRRKQYKRLAIRQIIQSIVMVTVQIGLGIVHGGAGGMVAGFIAGQAVATCIYVWNVWREDGEKIKLIDKRVILSNAKRYQDFPKLNGMQALLDGVRINLIPVMIGHFFTSTILGQYFLAFRIMQLPLSLISASISQVLFQRLTEQHNKGMCIWPEVRKAIIYLCLIASTVFIFTLILAPKLFVFIFGQSWADAGRYAQLLSFWICLNFISSTIATVPLVTGNQKAFFQVSLGYNICIPAAFYAASSAFHQFQTSLLCISCLGGLYVAGITFSIRKMALAKLSNEKDNIH